MRDVLAQLRQAIKRSKLTNYRIAKETGLAESHLSLLMRGRKGLSLANAQKLADFLGLEIVVRAKSKQGSK